MTDMSPIVTALRQAQAERDAALDKLATLASDAMLTEYQEAMARSDGLPTAGRFADLDYADYATAIHSRVQRIVHGEQPKVCGYMWEGDCGPCLRPYKHEPPHVCGCEQVTNAPA